MFNDPTNVVKEEGMNDQSGNDTQSSSSEDTSEEPEDFDDSANALWSLYQKEAKNRDEAQIQTLKDDMDGVLIFVCTHYLPVSGQPSDIILAQGRFILGGFDFVRRPKDPGLASEPRTAISLLPKSIRPNSCPDIATNRIDRHPNTPRYYSASELPYL
jgi:hypothetical protein